MTADQKFGRLVERVDALTQGVEMLASMHGDNQRRAARRRF